MKKVRNVILIVTVLMSIILSTNCYAKEDEILVAHKGGGGTHAAITTDLDSDTIINPDNYKPTSVKSTDLGAGKSKAEKIIGAVTLIGIVVSIASIMILGIKYMIGSIEEKAEYKKSMLPILIGMILLFGTSTVLNIINNVING